MQHRREKKKTHHVRRPSTALRHTGHPLPIRARIIDSLIPKKKQSTNHHSIIRKIPTHNATFPLIPFLPPSPSYKNGSRPFINSAPSLPPIDVEIHDACTTCRHKNSIENPCPLCCIGLSHNGHSVCPNSNFISKRQKNDAKAYQLTPPHQPVLYSTSHSTRHSHPQGYVDILQVTQSANENLAKS